MQTRGLDKLVRTQIIDKGGKDDIYRLADDLGFEIDDLFPIVDAAQLLAARDVMRKNLVDKTQRGAALRSVSAAVRSAKLHLSFPVAPSLETVKVLYDVGLLTPAQLAALASKATGVPESSLSHERVDAETGQPANQMRERTQEVEDRAFKLEERRLAMDERRTASEVSAAKRARK